MSTKPNLGAKGKGLNKTIPGLWKLWDLELIWEWDVIAGQYAEGLQMFMADRCLTSVSQAICYSESGIRSMPLEVVFTIKFHPLLIFHTENLMLLYIYIPASKTLHYFLRSREPHRWAPERRPGSSCIPVNIKSFNSGTQKWPICTKSRFWLSKQHSLYNAGYSHPSDSSANLNRWCIYLWITDHKKEKLCTIVNLTAFGLL